jgi:hypothetical protein
VVPTGASLANRRRSSWIVGNEVEVEGATVLSHFRPAEEAEMIGSLPPNLKLIALSVAFPLGEPLRWLGRHPMFGVIMGVIFGMLFGAIGHDYGLPGVFWHEELSVQFQAGISLGVLILLLFFFGYLVDCPTEHPADGPRARIPENVATQLGRGRPPAGGMPADAARSLRVHLRVMGLPVILLLLVALWHQATREGSPGWAQSWAFPLGAALTLLAAELALGIVPVRRWRRWHGWAAALVPVVMLNATYRWHEDSITAGRRPWSPS